MNKNLDKIISQLSSLPGAVEEYPFGPQAQVFKVAGKMFATLAISEEIPKITLKALPDDVVQLCDQYSTVTPGYYMNKKHWLTIELSGELSTATVKKLINDSYQLVVAKLSQKEKDNIQ